jgi:hypothetical protein
MHTPRSNPWIKVATISPLKFRQGQTQATSQIHGRNRTGNIQKAGSPPDSRQWIQQRRAFSAAENRDEDEEEAPYDSRDHNVFSASRFDNEDHEDEEEEDRYAMMGRRDYDFNGSYENDEGEN